MTRTYSSLFKMTIISTMAHSTIIMRKMMELSATSLSTSTIATIIFTMMEEPEAIATTCGKTHMVCTTVLCEQQVKSP
jgi:hypothetical protein